MENTKKTITRKPRKIISGKVVSTKNTKTISVLVETYKNHPIYKKRIKYSKKYAAHDEKEVAKVGDIVNISETRPLSATKRFILVNVKVKKEA